LISKQVPQYNYNCSITDLLQEKYFQKGLELFAKYNMTSLLRNGGIIPSDKVEYRLEDIRDAVQKTLGVNPQIQCIIEVSLVVQSYVSHSKFMSR